MQAYSLGDLWFNLDLSVSCGQTFRWRKYDRTWYAPSPYGDVAVWKVRQTGGTVNYEGMSEEDLVRYFSLDHNLETILKSIDCDPLIHDAVERCRGLRIIRQDPWECLISYICSSCANIPSIQIRIEKLAEKYGTRIMCDGKTFYSFPRPKAIAAAEVYELRSCNVGYRDTYIYGAAEMAAADPNWPEKIRAMPYAAAQRKLCKLNGVGPKIADCVLLFAFEKLESVPVDVWIERILRTKYVGREKKLASAMAGAYAREHFGIYAGYAQAYLFASREIISRKGA
ncbi:MAG: 8-oxoguanine DNA glycosylase [Methanocalculaceae archaeon]|jgi:N-glycosylase/DNA lyase|nr:8-oxoguanine DNA glycosylase [Methanocalculaceae archaeon]